MQNDRQPESIGWVVCIEIDWKKLLMSAKLAQTMQCCDLWQTPKYIRTANTCTADEIAAFISKFIRNWWTLGLVASIAVYLRMGKLSHLGRFSVAKKGVKFPEYV